MNSDYTTIIEFPNSPNAVFTAVNNVAGWWTENLEGSSVKLGDEFKVTFGATYIVLQVSELVQNYKVVWEVTDCHKHFLQNKREWVGTKVCFDIARRGTEGTTLTFTHIGLVSALECNDICRDAWQGYLHGSLTLLVNDGKGNPDRRV